MELFETRLDIAVSALSDFIATGALAVVFPKKVVGITRSM